MTLLKILIWCICGWLLIFVILLIMNVIATEHCCKHNKTWTKFQEVAWVLAFKTWPIISGILTILTFMSIIGII